MIIPSCVECLMLVVFVIPQEKIMMLQQNESLLKENERLQSDIDSLLKGKEMLDAQVLSLTKSLEVLQKDIKEKENRVTFSLRPLYYSFLVNNEINSFCAYQAREFKKTVKSQRKELDECRAEITTLKVLIENARSGNIALEADSEPVQSLSRSNSDDMRPLPNEVDVSKANTSLHSGVTESVITDVGKVGEADIVKEAKVNDNETSAVGSLADLTIADVDMTEKHQSDDATSIADTVPEDLLTPACESGSVGKSENISEDGGKPPLGTDTLVMRSEKLDAELHTEKMVRHSQSILSFVHFYLWFWNKTFFLQANIYNSCLLLRVWELFRYYQMLCLKLYRMF